MLLELSCERWWRMMGVRVNWWAQEAILAWSTKTKYFEVWEIINYSRHPIVNHAECKDIFSALIAIHCF